MRKTSGIVQSPSALAIDRFLAGQAASAFSYRDPGMTAMTVGQAAPHGYNADHNRVLLGHGEQAFGAARRALAAWKMFDIGWVTLFPADAPIRQGTVVAIAVKVFGFHVLNAARIVYTIDQIQSDVRSFGFAYGTLSSHAEMGEERFRVDWNLKDESVFYDLLAFSQPSLLAARIFYSYSRGLQKRFARDSLAAMVRAVGQQTGPRD